MDASLTLKWTKPVLFSTSDLKGKYSGVYIWGVLVDGKFHPYYVGKASDIFLRISQHMSSILGGQYTIFYDNSLLDFKNYKKQVEPGDENKGIAYRPNIPISIQKFIKNREDLMPHINNMVSTFAFSYAEVPQDHIQHLSDIESSCIEIMGLDKLANTKFKKPNFCSMAHEGDESILRILKI